MLMTKLKDLEIVAQEREALFPSLSLVFMCLLSVVCKYVCVSVCVCVCVCLWGGGNLGSFVLGGGWM